MRRFTKVLSKSLSIKRLLPLLKYYLRLYSPRTPLGLRQAQSSMVHRPVPRPFLGYVQWSF
ncbi:hypothetical protein I352_05644 [Cryptococcus deuterogattii MMRL2647]|nr:hypothetical protein I352_05644 [Cryptococcus deuterogattii MMRL2647]